MCKTRLVRRRSPADHEAGPNNPQANGDRQRHLCPVARPAAAAAGATQAAIEEALRRFDAEGRRRRLCGEPRPAPRSKAGAGRRSPRWRASRWSRWSACRSGGARPTGAGCCAAARHTNRLMPAAPTVAPPASPPVAMAPAPIGPARSEAPAAPIAPAPAPATPSQATVSDSASAALEVNLNRLPQFTPTQAPADTRAPGQAVRASERKDRRPRRRFPRRRQWPSARSPRRTPIGRLWSLAARRPAGLHVQFAYGIRGPGVSSRRRPRLLHAVRSPPRSRRLPRFRRPRSPRHRRPGQAPHLADGLTFAWRWRSRPRDRLLRPRDHRCPRSPIAYLNRGLAWQARGDLQQARRSQPRRRQRSGSARTLSSQPAVRGHGRQRAPTPMHGVRSSAIRATRPFFAETDRRVAEGYYRSSAPGACAPR